MYSPPVLWQINNLARSLNKKNYKNSIVEIHDLIKMHGDEAKIHLISSLLDEVDLKDRSQGQQKDSQKAITLHDEILQLFHLPNFATMICKIFESGNRQSILQHENRLPDEFSLGNVSRFLKLSPSQSVALAFALMHSQYRSIVRDATTLLKLKLVEVTSLSDIPSDMIHAIVYFISTFEEDLCPPELITKIRQIAHKESNRTDNSSSNSHKPLASAIKSNVCVSKALHDFGFQCSSTPNTFRRALYADISVGALNESHVADLLVMCIPRQNSGGSSGTSTENSLLYSLLHDSAGSGKESQQPLQWWNTDTICSVISEDCQALNWTNVLRCVDQAATLFIPSEAEFNLIAKLHLRMSSRPLQMAGLISPWENRLVQLTMLSYATKAPRNLVDFSELFASNNRLVAGGNGAEKEIDIPTPPNLSWMCPALYGILLSIASRGNSSDIVQLFMDASQRYPEYVLLGLAQVNEQVSGVRTEILRHILVKFSGLSGSRPSSDVVMSKLYEVNQDLLVLLCRIGLKNAQNVQDIAKIERRMKSYGSVGIRIQEECSIDEILGYWCYIADNASLNLEERLMTVLSKSPPFARNIVLFAKMHLEKLRPRSSHEGGLLSYENIAIILKCAQQYPNVVSTQDIRTLATMASQHQQQNAAAIQHHQRLQQQQQQQQQHGQGGLSESNSSRVPGGNGPGPNAQSRGGKASTPESEEIEEVANSYFQKIYTSDMTIAEVIQLLKRFKSSNDPREQEIFRCMIHNLFDEYRFFHKYPEKELQVTGRLFGTLIQHQLVSSITLGIALRYVLEALRKDPEQGGSNEKMFRFGKISLEQFRNRLNEWPQYCSHLIQIQHLPKHCVELYTEAQRAVSNPNPSATNVEGSTDGAGGMSMVGGAQGMSKMSQVSQMTQGVEDIAIVNGESTKVPTIQPLASSVDTVDSEVMNRVRRTIDEMCSVNNASSALGEPPQPPEGTRDQILFIVNNIAKSNVDQKTDELKGILGETYYTWFANYLIVKRVSTQPNLHSTYLTVIDILDDKNLLSAILNSGYQSITKLLQSSKITTSSSERSLLRNLGMWLGQLTLARNKPILQRRCDLKELILWGYESGRLIAVCSFVAKTIEGCRDSKVFRPPNPWLMALLGVLRELYDIEDLKMNIKFEVQVLCKNIGVKIEDVPKSDLISKSALPVKERNPDFNVKNGATSASPSLLQSTSPSLQASQTPTLASSSPLTHQQLDAGGAVGGVAMSEFSLSAGVAGGNQSQGGEQTVIPNLASHVVINPSLQVLSSNFSLRRLIPIAVDRAIREIIQPVVERSVTIACVTTKQMILKDFVTEANENHLRRSAHLMVSNLAGSLALVTCKESLRISICNHIRTLFSSTNLEHNMLEQIIQVCSNENLDLGCMLIERAVTEKAIRDIDEALTSAIQVRRKHREGGNVGGAFVDTAVVSKSAQKYAKDLPDVMKAAPGGLLQSQVLVYEAFKRQRANLNGANTLGSNSIRQSSPVALTGQSAQSPNLPPLPPSNSGQSTTTLSMAQALEAYQHALSRVDMALKAVMVQAQGRDVSLSMLGADHEILARLREVIHITQCTQPSARLESAMTFAESVFKRLVETVSINDTLRLEVMVGIMEALRDACGGSRKFSPDMISWLSHYATFNVNDEGNRKLHRDILTLLLRAKLLRPQEADVYFAGNLDSGRNMLWVEIALGFIRHCLAEGLAQTYQFSKVFDIVSKMRPANANIRKQLQKWLTDIRTLAANREEQKHGTNAAGANQSGHPSQTSAPGANQPQRDSVREHVMVLLDRWLRVWNSSNDQVFGQYLQVLHQYGVLKTEEAADRFFRLATEICVEACVKSASSSPADSAKDEGQSTIQYTVIDALSKLFLLLVRLADKEASDVSVRINLLNRILNSIARSLHDDHENKKHLQQQQPNTTQLFDQRPYYRLFSNLMLDLGTADPKQDPNPSLLPLLQTYYQIYLALQPSKVPGFAFGWLQLVSHKSFMPNLLLARGQKGWPHMHRLLLALLHFMQPFLRSVQMNDPIRQLYKGTLKVLLVLLHDFPEFLCDYHLSFCEAIPHPCVQLRNLVLSAFPRSMRLPDPFTPNLKIDLLPEIAQAPRVLTDFVGILNDRGIRQRLESHLMNPTGSKEEIMNFLLSTLSPPGGQLNTVLATSVVMFVATHGIAQQQQQQQQQGTKPALQLSVALDVFQHLVEELNAEGRYHVLNVMVNQLRYPNNQTYYFSCVLLTMFQESTNELLQEQITRVLLERLIVHRPHPWGLLITFIELIKNPCYNFWQRSFTRCAPEIERVFESVSRSCIGSPVGESAGSNENTSESSVSHDA
mmetsp:Transcript_6288/g.12026  ORF Transcript_6288/g.12026 Transcript_6288/m.12026 type:complete len:2318 (-) Transcript_6288:299-7252(-)